MPFRFAFAILFAATIHSPHPAWASPPENPPAVPAILSSAESLFEAMKSRDYPAIFSVLSAKSRETIVQETYAALSPDERNNATPDSVREDFVTGGSIAKEYWGAFLKRFDPTAALDRSRWEMGPVGKDRAEILITYQDAERPAVLRMYLETGGWKTGLVETFWSRKR